MSRDSDPPEDGDGTSLVPLRNEDGSAIVSARLLARARTVAEALFLTASGPPPRERMDWLVTEVEDFLARAGSRSRFVVGLALFAVCFLAPLVSGSLQALAKMSVDRRARALSRLEDVFGAPVLAVKALMSVIYYEHPDAARAVGFDGTCLLDEPRHLPTAT